MARKTKEERIKGYIDELKRLGKMTEVEEINKLLDKDQEKAFHRARWAWWKARKEAGLTKPRKKTARKAVEEPRDIVVQGSELRDTVDVQEIAAIVSNPEYELLVERLVSSGFRKDNAEKMAAAVHPRYQSARLLRIFITVHVATFDEAVAKATALIKWLAQSQEVQEAQSQEAQEAQGSQEAQEAQAQ